MREQPGLYRPVIRDNGTKSQVPGTGLSNMEQQVKELGDLLRIQIQKGFEIFITIPRRQENEHCNCR